MASKLARFWSRKLSSSRTCLPTNGLEAEAASRELLQCCLFSGTSTTIKGCHSLLQVSTFNLKHFLSNLASGGDQIFEDHIHNKGGTEEDCGLRECENSEDVLLGPSLNSFKTDSLDDCIGDEEVDNAAEFHEHGMKAISPTPQGIYKAIVLGEAGYAPSQKIMRNGYTVTQFSLGTSGMRNNRRPFENETPEQYAKRSSVQWHRIAVYQHKLGALAMKFVKKGSQVYVEGNMETRVFFDPASDTVKRIQEIAVRQNGRIIFLDQNSAEAATKCQSPSLYKKS